MRVSLKDLFAVTAFGAVMAWCAAEAGVDNTIFWVVLGVATVMSAAFVGFAKNRQGRWATLFFPVAAFFFCAAPLASMVMLYFVVLIFAAGVVCAILPPLPVRALIGIAMGCIVVAFLGGVFDSRVHVERLREMQREFPVVSLASRLKYERRPGAALQAPTLAPEVDQDLADWERRCDRHSYRQEQLRRLHDRQYELFVRASGFGVGRMMRPYPEGMRRAGLRDIPFDERDMMESYDQGSWREGWRSAKSNDAQQLHVVSRDDFLNADGFGATIAPLMEVAGFIEHGLHRSPTALLEDSAAWTIARMELVSLLKFDAPRVYVLDHFPRMDQLAAGDVATRPLDVFESAALAQLRTDEDVVIADEGSATRMLGSLRAGNQCLECHSVPRGTLLGAFSYALLRGDAAPDALAWADPIAASR